MKTGTSAFLNAQACARHLSGVKRALAILLALHFGAPVTVEGAPPPAGPVSPAVPGLVWDAELKEVTAKSGDAQAQFRFWFTNSSPAEIQIQSARSSCFCTVARLPAEPWVIPPGTNGCIDVTMDLAGKRGTVSKPVNIITSAGIKSLTVRTHIPTQESSPGSPGEMTDEDRLRNLQLASNDRQVVFKNRDCAQCHALPARGKLNGAQLYAGVCAICHDSSNRAANVPDLRLVGRGKDAQYWRSWIAHGRPGSVMPAFAESEGGPLSEAQIDSLARHLVNVLPDAGSESVKLKRAPIRPDLNALPLSESLSVFPLPPEPAPAPEKGRQ